VEGMLGNMLFKYNQKNRKFKKSIINTMKDPKIKKERIAAVAIMANFFLAGGKITIGFFSKSSAVLAEGLHSFMDVFASTISYFGIKLSQKPADKKHPYGYYKFEVLAGTIITFILLITGVGIIYESYQGALMPEKIIFSPLAFGIMAISAIVNEIMARLKIYYGKKENSISLLSDGIHSRIDVYISLAVFTGLFLTKYWAYIDSLLAFLIGLYIIKESFSLGKEAIDSLVDSSAGEEIEEEIKSIIKNEKIELSLLKTQKKGSIITASLEIKLPNNLKINEASNISENLRKKLLGSIEKLQYIVIQITSHELETSFYQPEFGKGFGWQRQGPGGYCVCPKCGYKISHQRGTPCSGLKCPNCHISLQRE
jgi:cation diffusion facilitator family transporter